MIRIVHCGEIVNIHGWGIWGRRSRYKLNLSLRPEGQLSDRLRCLSQSHQRNFMPIPESSKESNAYPGLIKGILCLSRTHQRNHMLIPDLSRGKLRRFPKGDRKALWSRPQARNPLLHRRNQMVMDNFHRQVFVRGESNPNMYFSTRRKVPKAHRGGQSVHEGVAAPDPRILIACARIAGAPR